MATTYRTPDAFVSQFPEGSAVDGDGMLAIGGCRANVLATEFGTPVLVVAEDALRARAREYADELTSRWPKSRVVFASKAFPCTAVQRVMVEEDLGLDVAGGGEILTAIKAGVDPRLVVLHGNAKSDDLEGVVGIGPTRAEAVEDIECNDGMSWSSGQARWAHWPASSSAPGPPRSCATPPRPSSSSPAPRPRSWRSRCCPPDRTADRRSANQPEGV